MRRLADEGAAGNMRSAGRFRRALVSHGLIRIPEVEDDHQYVLHVSKDWDSEEWHAMYKRHGPPPWPGEHDGLIPAERWKEHYGPRPRLLRRAKQRNG